MSYGGYPPYVSVAEKRAKAEKKLKQMMKKNPDIRPVVIEGSAIAVTWWGKSWNKNLERYADYENRIGRGRSYVKHSAVLDLQITSGTINSLVQGSTSRPYSVEIKIAPIKKSAWSGIKEQCEGRLDSLQELLEGKFPKKLSDIFTTEGTGLFPTPKEIRFHCSCPDSAYMCKHIAATLYGTGARLDNEPAIFFKLRKVEIDDLISEAVRSKTEKMLKKTEVKSSRVISDSNISDLFGIDIDLPAGKKGDSPDKRSATSPKKKPVSRKTAAAKKATPKISIKSPPKKKKTEGKKVVKKTAMKKVTKKAVKKRMTKKT